ncbi:FAD/NAD(P)-binding domain-containing protein [Schizopora paradoxa]|uniref:FAD/NAD(P)-binding domain-containing protein n=1 Tax=Schizopora paradoxa TaxID=27342 RepID=A0A0H2SD40_9AGAM|nr:FAD/NAD(P)-binding domain-containing protein [Schizopora paradoxa]
MSWIAAPTESGTYNVKAFSGTGYWRYATNSGGDQWAKIDDYDATDDDAYSWKITLTGSGRFTIEPVASEYTAMGISTRTDVYEGYGYAMIRSPRRGFTAPEWQTVPSSSGKYSRVFLVSHPKASEGNIVLDTRLSYNSEDKNIHFAKDNNSNFQRWIFRKVGGETPPPPPPPPPRRNDKSFEDLFFTLTPEVASAESYDIIIIGTGIGGGVVAGDLFDSNSRMGKNAKSVLVIERGGLSFHSHCLNASRPAGFGEDRGQQNDTFFAMFKDDYTFPGPNSDWKGGPMYCLGGRSAAWGLFAPRIHDETLKNHMQPMRDPLLNKWYREAEKLMSLYLPTTNTYQANVMERLNMSSKPELACQWQWGRIASEFRDDRNFDFARGAYSTIDKLLEITMSKRPKSRGSNELVEHKNWKILLHTEAREIQWDGSGTRATGVWVRDASESGKPGAGRGTLIRLNPGGKVVLGAGSVHSPAILMRSGREEFLRNNGGLRLTDHDIFAKAYTFQYLDDARRETIGAMKLQTYLTLPRPKGAQQDVALCNISIDASSFLPREYLPNEFFRNEQFPQLIFAFIKPCRLNPSNNITLDANQDPIVTINREVAFDNNDKDVAACRGLAQMAKKEIKAALKIEYINDKDDVEGPETYFKPLELGGVAHELGTIPFRGDPMAPTGSCIDQDLKLRDHEGVYVCDLSIFPMSPEVNPTLTLAALALRLSRNELLPRELIHSSGGEIPRNLVWVMNQTGENIKIFISNNAGAPLTSDDREMVLGPGDDTQRVRKEGFTESVAVYRLKYNSDSDFLAKPTFWTAKAGELTVICDK